MLLGGTPLCFALLWSQAEPVVQYLIEKGANIEAKDQRERTPLHEACQKGNLSIVQYLIEKGANIEAKENNQQTPLHYASYFGQIKMPKTKRENTLWCCISYR